MEGNKQIKKKNFVEMDWNWSYQCAFMISKIRMGMYIHMYIYSAVSARRVQNQTHLISNKHILHWELFFHTISHLKESGFIREMADSRG